MGRPKLPLGIKKSHAQSKAEYEVRKKKEVGEKNYLAKRAKQRAESRVRCWAKKTEQEKNDHRSKQRKRAQSYRTRKKRTAECARSLILATIAFW